MTPKNRATSATVLGLGLTAGLLTGCSSTPTAEPTVAGVATTAEPSPTESKLTKAEKAEAKAIEVAKDLAQMVTVGVFEGSSTLTDIVTLASGQKLEQQQQRGQQFLAQGWAVKEDGQKVVVSDLKVLTVYPKNDPELVVIRYCIDSRDVIYTRKVDGKAETDHGVRVGTEDTVEKTKVGWRVTQSDIKESACPGE